ncbi:MAG: signal recognition particle receptor subunit alpha [Candidatus Odinarchaeota archaeon]
MSKKDEKGSQQSSLSVSLRSIMKRLRGLPVVDEKAIQNVLSDLRKSLLTADVKIDLVDLMIQRVEKRALTDKTAPGISRTDYVVKILHDELINLLGKKFQPLRLDPLKLNKIMLIGIQGSGKTTSLSKMAVYLKKRGYKVGVIGADTFRPGAYVQLKQLLSTHDIEVFGYEKPGKDAVKTTKEGLKHFSQDKKINAVLIDTSGRHKEETSLFKEMKAIAEKSRPDEIILVVDGTIGQRAYEQSEAFNSTVKAGSIILTKLDGSAKGGGAISAVAATGSKIRFTTNGERIEDIQEFNPTKFVESLLGMGDLEGILQRVAEAGLMEDQEELERALKKGKMTLRLYKLQMEKMAKMSSLEKFLTMLPGMGSGLPPGFEKQSKENMRKFVGIFRSMTEEELDDISLIKASRVKRIARGSGTTSQDVRMLMKQFDVMQKMLKQYKSSRRKKTPFGDQSFGGF